MAEAAAPPVVLPPKPKQFAPPPTSAPPPDYGEGEDDIYDEGAEADMEEDVYDIPSEIEQQEMNRIGKGPAPPPPPPPASPPPPDRSPSPFDEDIYDTADLDQVPESPPPGRPPKVSEVIHFQVLDLYGPIYLLVCYFPQQSPNLAPAAPPIFRNNKPSQSPTASPSFHKNRGPLATPPPSPVSPVVSQAATVKSAVLPQCEVALLCVVLDMTLRCIRDLHDSILESALCCVRDMTLH